MNFDHACESLSQYKLSGRKYNVFLKQILKNDAYFVKGKANLSLKLVFHTKKKDAVVILNRLKTIMTFLRQPVFLSAKI